MKERISINSLVDLLAAMISLDVPKSVIANWGQETREEVQKYALKVHLRASDNIVRIPKKPSVLSNPRIKPIGYLPLEMTKASRRQPRGSLKGQSK